jgi:drug/metabolite transporter (DMT)-like permease
VGYWLWLWALRHASPPRVTLLFAPSPVTATPMGALWLDERLRLAAWVGIAAVALGPALGGRSRSV